MYKYFKNICDGNISTNIFPKIIHGKSSEATIKKSMRAYPMKAGSYKGFVINRSINRPGFYVAVHSEYECFNSYEHGPVSNFPIIYAKTVVECFGKIDDWCGDNVYE